jgi:sporulation protein YlmC with PRC-barrel domain
MDSFWTKSMLGKPVITADGVELGDVVDMEIDLSSWSVRWIDVRISRAHTDAFKIDAPLVMGTRVVSISPRHVARVGERLELAETLLGIVPHALVSYETDATRHL